MQQAYWWAARALSDAGYLVLTFDAQGQGEAETFGHAPGDVTPNEAGFPFQQEANFVDGTVDALRYLLSSASAPYVPGGWTAADAAKARAADPSISWANPLAGASTRAASAWPATRSAPGRRRSSSSAATTTCSGSACRSARGARTRSTPSWPGTACPPPSCRWCRPWTSRATGTSSTRSRATPPPTRRGTSAGSSGGAGSASTPTPSPSGAAPTWSGRSSRRCSRRRPTATTSPRTTRWPGSTGTCRRRPPSAARRPPTLADSPKVDRATHGRDQLPWTASFLSARYLGGFTFHDARGGTRVVDDLRAYGGASHVGDWPGANRDQSAPARDLSRPSPIAPWMPPASPRSSSP